MNARIATSLARSNPVRTAITPASGAQEPPPWRESGPDAAASARKILAGGSIVQPRGEKTDSGKIFTLYEAVSRLRALVSAVGDGDVQKGLQAQAQRKFAAGLGEVRQYLDANSLEKVVLLPSEKLSAASTEAAISRNSYRYVTPPVHSGSADEAVPAFAGTSGFRIDIGRSNDTVSVDIDLSSLAVDARSVSSVAELINNALDAAGVTTGIEATRTGPPDEYGYPTGNAWGFAIKGVQSETVTFVATGATGPSLYLTGTSGSSGQVSRWRDLAQAEPVSAVVDRIEAESGALTIVSTVVGGDGGVYTLARSEGSIDGQSPRGDSDLILIRSESTGKRIWSRFLGTKGSAEGSALAVADDGRVAIGGVIRESVGDAAVGGGRDGFVVVYDALGRETFARQRGVRGDDAVTALAFGDDGRLHIGGWTAKPLDDSAGAGGASDAYIETLDADGARLWIRHVGSDGHDAVTALVADDSGGVVAATRESGDILLRRFAGSEDDELDWTHSLGPGRAEAVVLDETALYVSGQTTASGRTNGLFSGQTSGDGDAFALRIDLTRELVEVVSPVSEPENPTLDDGAAAGVGDAVSGDAVGEVADPEPDDGAAAGVGDAVSDNAVGEVADPEPDDGAAGGVGDAVSGDANEVADPEPDDGAAGGVGDAVSGDANEVADPPAPTLVPTGPVLPVETWFRRIGGDGSQTAPAIAVSGAQVYLAGSTPGDGSELSRSYLSALSAAEGSDIWLQKLSGRGGVSRASDLALDPVGDSDLSLLGLPRGPVLLGDTEHITDRTTARPGDHFFISVDGGSKRKIVIERGDSYRHLSFKINGATLLDAKASVVTSSGERRLTITPAASARIELFAGSGGADALSALGLPEGAVYGSPAESGDSSSAGPDIVALDLRFDADVSDVDTLEMLDTALRRLRTAHRTSTEDPILDKLSSDRGPVGPPPAYLQQQISNYQAGLLRLQSSQTNLGPLSGLLI